MFFLSGSKKYVYTHMLTLIKLNRSPGAWVAWLSCRCWPLQAPLWLSLQVHWLSAASPVHPAASPADVCYFSGVWLESQGSIQNCYYIHKLYENKVQMVKCQQAQHLPHLLLWTSWERHSYLHRSGFKAPDTVQGYLVYKYLWNNVNQHSQDNVCCGFRSRRKCSLLLNSKGHINYFCPGPLLTPLGTSQILCWLPFFVYSFKSFFVLLIVLSFIWSSSELLQILSPKRCAV